MTVHQLTSTLGTVDFTDHTTVVWLTDNAPHKRPKDKVVGNDWTTGGSYLVYVSEGTHVFEGDIIFLGRTAANPSRTLEDAQGLFDAVLAQISAAEQYGPSGGVQGAVVTYEEQLGSRTTTDSYTVVHGQLEEPSRNLAGDYIRSRLTLTCNKS